MRSETNSIESKNVWWQHFKNVLSLVQLHQPIRKSLRTHTLTAAAAFARIIAVLIFVKCSWKFSLCVCQFLRAWMRWLAQHCAVPWHPRHGTTWILECFDFFFKIKQIAIRVRHIFSISLSFFLYSFLLLCHISRSGSFSFRLSNSPRLNFIFSGSTTELHRKRFIRTKNMPIKVLKRSHRSAQTYLVCC